MNITPEMISLSMPFIEATVETWVKPMLEEAAKNKKFNKNFNKLTEDNFFEYLKRAYNNQLIMDTIVFKNKQKTIDELYIPLKIETNDLSDEKRCLIESYPNKLITKYKKMLIVDTAGMGKSTLMKWMFISAVRENKGIPIFINLRRLNSDLKIIDIISEELNGINNSFDIDYIQFLLNRGDFIFFFDGFDEIALDDRKLVIRDIQNFVSKCGENLFFMSSREESSLASFGDFYRFSIVSLSNRQAFSLLKKYDKNGNLSKELISKLKVDDNLSLLREFLRNPLMTTLLYKAYEFKKVIPYKKHIFYRQVYNALFDEHDLSKGDDFEHEKQSCLDVDDFHKVLRSFAFISMAKGKNSYEKEELVDILEKVQVRNEEISFDLNCFIKDCLTAVPLLIEDGLEFKWVHKSFLEYFASLYLRYDSYEKLPNIINKILKSSRSDRYLNVFDFYYDLDIKSFNSNIIAFIASDYEKYFENETNLVSRDSNIYKKLELRLALHYTNNLFISFVKPNNVEEDDGVEVFEEFLDLIRYDSDYKKTWKDTGYISGGNDFEICIVQESKLAFLIELLEKKNDRSILEEIPKEFLQEAELKDVKDDLKSSYYYLGPQTDNVFNKIENYDLTTKYIVKSLSRHDGKGKLYIDINKCKKFIDVQKQNELIDKLEIDIF